MKNKLMIAVVILVLLSGPAARSQSIKPAPPANNKISLDIKGMDVVDVLKMLSSRSGLNIVVGKNVTGRVTLFLKDVDLWDALEIILLANDLAYDRKGEIINVMTQRDYELIYGERFQDKKEAKIIALKYSKAADTARSLTQIKSNVGKVVVDEATNTLVLIDAPEKIIAMSEFIADTDRPLETKIFPLNYAVAEKLQAKLQETITKGSGSIKIDERTNKIIITDYPEKLELISKLISAFDEKTQQVLINAQIIEVNPSDKLEFGVDWDYWIKKNFKISNALPVGTANRMFLGTLDNDPSGPGDFKAIIDVLRTIGDTKILSSPSIIAMNNQEAKILQGTKDAFITSTTTVTQQNPITTQTVNFIDVGVKLYVTPTINNDNFVTMKIRPEVSSAERTDIISEGQVTQVPIVTTSEAETTIMVKDGVTVIIGGLKKDQRTKTVKKIPVLGDIPLLGHAFRSTSDEVQRSELIILLTPYILGGDKSYTDASEITPMDGVTVRMENGEIVKDRSHGIREGLTTAFYYGYKQLVTNRIGELAKRNYLPGKNGEVVLSFRIASSGKLIGEPRVIKSSDDALVSPSVKTVKDSSPFPSFPAELDKPEETFIVSLSYR